MATTEEVMAAAQQNGVTAPAAAANPASTYQAPAYADQATIAEINRMYDAQVNSQKASLESAYNQNLSNLEANRGKIAQKYQTQRNINAVNYERNRRNFNQQAAMNGLNTGAGSQAALAQNNMFQQGVAQLGASEATANADLEKSIADLKVKYEADVNDAIAKNDYNRAAALLDEYNQAYSRAMTKAQQLAQYGDFSGYSSIYGADAARQMKATWQIQNPLIAYNLGQISAAKYKQITGANPPGYSSGRSGGGGRGYGGYSRGGSNNGNGNNSNGDAPTVGAGGVVVDERNLGSLIANGYNRPGGYNPSDNPPSQAAINTMNRVAADIDAAGARSSRSTSKPSQKSTTTSKPSTVAQAQSNNLQRALSNLRNNWNPNAPSSVLNR